jgi:glycolate oxidase
MSDTTTTRPRGVTEAGTIQPAVLRALQNIVGERNASAERAILSTYYWNGGVGAMPGPKQGKHWPLAVVMPGSTEEVAAIVKLCVAEGIRYRAHSTGNGGTFVSQLPNVIVVDLMRMNRIVKLDAANQMAVIEPYVTAGRLQAEAMKVGLTCHIVGAGPSHSPLASATSFLGVGITGASTGHNVRNLLSLEWVSPTGDIVRIGSEGDDWFSEEGPGPGFRGIIRGLNGANGSLGIFTRIGYKLYPWAGPGQMELTHTHPQIGFRPTPKMRLFLPVWPSAEQMTEATFRINRSRVAFAVLRMPPGHIGWTLTKDNGEYIERRGKGDLSECTAMDNRFAWQILTTGVTERHAALQARTVERIVAETGGRFMALSEQDEQVLARNLITSAYVARVFRGAGSGGTSFGVMDSFNLWPGLVRAAEGQMAKERQPGGAFVTDGKEGFWAWPTESRQLWCENILASQGGTEKGIAAGWKSFFEHLYLVDRSPRFGVMAFIGGPLFDLFSSRRYGASHWMRRIKLSLDPGNHADHSMSVGPKEVPVARAWPLIMRFLFSRWGAPVLRAITRKAARMSL